MQKKFPWPSMAILAMDLATFGHKLFHFWNNFRKFARFSKKWEFYSKIARFSKTPYISKYHKAGLNVELVFFLIGVYRTPWLDAELVFFLFHFWNILRNLRKKKALEYFSWNNRSFFEKRAFWVYHFVLFLITKTIIFLKKTHSKS